ncbi:hypothetical protein CR513_07748, partial [Mucuna pruriens]
IAPMGQEDETPKYNRIGGGSGGGSRRKGVGRPCKEPKEKKVPRRGLGVAQLEKIRLEEEQKNATIIASPTNSPYDLHLQLPNLFHFNQSFSLNSLPSSTISLANSGGSKAGWHNVPLLGHMSRPQLWAPHDFEFEKNFGMDPRMTFASSFPFESNPVRSFPNWVQREQQQQQQYPSSSMVSASLGTSSTIVPHSLVEPPSKQNYSQSYIFKRQEEKVIGVKRPNLFSLDISPMSSSNFKPFTFLAPTKSSETISCGSGRGFKLDFGNSTLREIPSLSPSNSELISKKRKNDNTHFGGDFLTLAPPTPCSHSMLKSSSTFLAFNHQGNMEDQVPPPLGHNQFNQQQQHWNYFFPPATSEAQIGQQSN